jgi:hypothetical protein
MAISRDSDDTSEMIGSSKRNLPASFNELDSQKFSGQINVNIQ